MELTTKINSNGGLRYSLEGGSFQAYRDKFTWSGTKPSVAAFQKAIEDAFGAWRAVDPATSLGSDLSFVADLGTTVEKPTPGGFVDTGGAEIDLLASTETTLWDVGGTFPWGATAYGTLSITDPAKLTTGKTVTGWPIVGADIHINSNPGVMYTLPLFQLLMTHEIGHALGLGDGDTTINTNRILDDNYDGSSSTTALSTLTNSWAGLVNPTDPSMSPSLSIKTVANADPGFDTPWS